MKSPTSAKGIFTTTAWTGHFPALHVATEPSQVRPPFGRPDLEKLLKVAIDFARHFTAMRSPLTLPIDTRKPRTFGAKRLARARHSGWFCLANRRPFRAFVRGLALPSRYGKRTKGENARLRLLGNAYKNEEMSRPRETLFVDLYRPCETFRSLCTRNLPQNQCNCYSIHVRRARLRSLTAIGWGPAMRGNSGGATM
jgi:hypothetical protein